jgi:hypothetical protein
MTNEFVCLDGVKPVRMRDSSSLYVIARLQTFSLVVSEENRAPAALCNHVIGTAL